MKQTPMHFDYNPDILRIMPLNLRRVIEVGCSSGALAKAYIGMNPECIYTGIEIDPNFAAIAKASCNEVICGNIENIAEEKFLELFPSDCWVFGDTLEHLYDPWALLQRIRSRLAPDSQIIACIPNAQHWSVQVNLSSGLFRYQDHGLMDRTHIRWFTRTTMIELFESTGYKIIEGFPRIFNEPAREKVLPVIGAMAQAIGTDPQQAVNDAIPLQWVIKVMPV
ncbi:MAG: class I SAM-dependent methyltransferase [Gallionella sp.]|nr:class I SAM-dependent methyltransferase [Gallionella sp.]